MVEVANVAGDQDKTAGLRGRSNQTIPVADRPAPHFPFSAEIASQDGKGFVQWQQRQMRSQISGKALPKLVARRRNLRSVTDFFQADDGREEGFGFGLKSRFDARVGFEAHQFAQDIGIEQIHGSIKGGRRRAGFAMALILDLFEDLKNGIVVGNAGGIEIRTVRQPWKLSPLRPDADGRPPGQSITNGLLILVRQAFHEFNDVQGDHTHESTFAEFRRDVKRFPTSENVRQTKPPPWNFAAEFGAGCAKVNL